MTLSSLLFLIWLWVILILFLTFGREQIGYPAQNFLLQKYAKYDPLLIGIWILKCILMSFFVLNLWYRYWWWNSSEDNSPLESWPEAIMIIDVSLSMEHDDLSPSRLEKAKSLIWTSRFWSMNTRVGIVVFAGKAYTLSPLSEDIRGLMLSISWITTELIDQSLPDTSGTALGDALLVGESLFSTGREVPRDIYLFTDGRANQGISPTLLIPEFQSKNIRIHSIALGKIGEEALTIPDHTWWRQILREGSGAVLDAWVDTSLLMLLSRETWGVFTHIQTTEDSWDIFPTYTDETHPHVVYLSKKILFEQYTGRILSWMIGILLLFYILLLFRRKTF